MSELVAVVAVGFRSFAALVLISAAAAKLGGLEAFIGAVRDYRVAPAGLSRPLALGTLAAELLIGLGLLVPAFAQPASIAAAALLVAYAAAIAVNLRRGRETLDCGCHLGARRRPIAPGLVLRNLLFAGGVAAGALATVERTPAGWLVALAAGGVGFVLYLAADLTLARRMTGHRLPLKSVRS